jgi:hypothetical protein
VGAGSRVPRVKGPRSRVVSCGGRVQSPEAGRGPEESGLRVKA